MLFKTKKKNKEKKQKKKFEMTEKKSIDIAFNVLALFCIALFSMALVQKSYQNDTFYTIKIGQLIRQNGIDYLDHFSWHENLPYMYPHWIYDVIISLIFDFCGGFKGVYISTIILSAILGITIYIANKRISKNQLIAFFMTIVQMYLMGDYIAARAQLVTFILFVLTIIFIEKFLEKPKKRYAAALIIIPIIIANVHSAVFPFYFVLYLPYIGEYLVRVLSDMHIFHRAYQAILKYQINSTNKKLKSVDKEKARKYQKKLAMYTKKIEQSNTIYEKNIIKQNDRRKNPYKIKIERNDNVLKLIVIMCICFFTGLLTPIKDMPYTYTWKIMQGNTTSNISEHLPLTLINYKDLMIFFSVIFLGMTFTKIKIRLRDLFFIGGLTFLAFMSRRQVSMLVLFGGMSLTRMISEFVDMYDKKGTEEFLKYITTIAGECLLILFIFAISYCVYKPNIGAEYIDKSSYPVEACDWIKQNLDYKNIKIFNDYNYGSYMLYQDIPVFIDSRCDLYTPEFNGTYNKEKKKYEGEDIFTDYIETSSIGKYYETTFEKYQITHVITKTNSKLNMLISRDDNYNKVYSDSHFIIYERNTKSDNEDKK